MTIAIAAMSFVTSCEKAAKKELPDVEVMEVIEVEEVGPNALSAAEIADGWKLLFDGTTSTGWRGYKKDYFPNGWQIIDGTLQCIGTGRGEAGNKEGGDIIYDKEFQNLHI